MRRYRHLSRLREIINVFARAGFSYLVSQLGLGHLISLPWRVQGPGHLASAGEKLREALEQLGPTFVKLGQVMSTRPDILPPEIISSLRRLQDEVAPIPQDLLQQQVEKELGMPADRVFAWFDQEPLAAASIGQVHRARLVTGEEVVVKVRRPGIEETVEVDLDILFMLARLARAHTPWGEIYDFVAMVEEFARTIRQEMDFTQEGRNADRLRENMAGLGWVRVPRVFWEYTTAGVLVMEYVPGLKLNDLNRIRQAGLDTSSLATNLIHAFLHQVLDKGFFHADPHPGNLAALPGGTIVFMDFGMMGTLTRQRQEQFGRLIIGLLRRNSRHIVRTISDMGIVPKGTDILQLRRDVDRLRDRYYEVPFQEIHLGKAIQEILELAFKYRIQLPSEFTYLAKALITLEGLALDLDPNLSIVKVAEPVGRRLLRQQYSYRSLRRRIQEHLDDLVEVPSLLYEIVSQAASGNLAVHVEHEGLAKVLVQISRLVSQLSLSLVLLSFSIVMSGLVISSALGEEAGGFFFRRLPVLEIGFAAATLMGIWLVISIYRSTRL